MQLITDDDIRRRVRLWPGVSLPDNDLPNIVFFSGGKDSTALLILMRERGIRIDHVVFFDAGTWDWPEMPEHVKRVSARLEVNIETARPDRDFDYYFSEHIITRGKNKGRRGYGWPLKQARWCTARKVLCLENHCKQYAPYNSFIGYAHTERDRAFTDYNTSRDNLYFPLITYHWGPRINLRKCLDYGFYGDFLYTHTHRTSCYCCPLQDLRTLRNIKLYRPELFSRMLQMDDKAWNSFYRGITPLADMFPLILPAS